MSDTVKFLDAIFGDKVDGTKILIWTLPDKRSYWCDTVNDAAAVVERVKSDHDVYFGIGLSEQDFGATKRCPASEVCAIPGVWADFDIQGAGHLKPNLPPSREAIMQLLDDIGLPPTLAVNSGHGLQCYWLLKEPFQIDTDDRRLQAQSLSRRWNNTLRALAKRRGWDVDATHDLARVYRVPGTTNRKVLNSLVPVVLLSYNDHRYSVDEIAEKFIPDELPARQTPSNEIVDEEFVLSPTATIDHDLYEAVCEVEPRFAVTWNRKRKDMQDQSASSYDLSLANIGAQAGWSDQQIVDMLIHHRRKHKDDLKLRPDYYRMTIRKARAAVTRAVAVEQLDDILYQTNDEDRAALEVTPEDQRTATPIISDDTRQKLLNHLSDLLGFKIVNIIKYVSSEPSYRLVTERDGIMLGNVGGLIKQESLRYQVAALTGFYIPKFKPNIWDKIAQSLLNACEEQSAGEEATDQGAIRSWLELYLNDNPPSPGGLSEEVVNNQSPYRCEATGDIHIFGMGFREYLKRKYGEQISQKKVGVLLRLHKCDPLIANCKINGKPTTRSVWRVPSNIRGEFE